VRIVICVEELQLLLAVAGILRSIHIQNDALCIGGQLVDHNLRKNHRHCEQVLAVHPVLKAADRRLTCQSILGAKLAPARCAKSGIVRQSIQIIGVFVSERDGKDAFAKQVEDCVGNLCRITLTECVNCFETY
jgi:hypothetical protein